MVTGGARAIVYRRSAGACESCGLEWPWQLYLSRVDPSRASTAANLRALCGPCSMSEPGPFALLVVEPSRRERMREANNRRSGVAKLTAARRRRLIEARGSGCEICGVPGSVRSLQVHHRLAVLQGGDDSDANLLVLCFACHHHLQPCATGCGRWAKKPATLCRHCRTRRELEQLYPAATWEAIKFRHPSLATTWPPGYEPRSSLEVSKSGAATAAAADGRENERRLPRPAPPLRDP